MKFLAAAVAVTALLAAPAWAQITVREPWVRATVPQQSATGAFMQITAAKDLRLVEVRSPAADVVELHEMTMTNNVMKMRAIAGLDLPAGRTVELKPSGHHVMLMGLKAPLKEGSSVPITLVLEGKDGKRETAEVTATVRALTASGSGHAGH